MMKRLFLFLIVSFLHFQSFAFKIEWSDLQFCPAPVENIYPIYESHFFVKRQSKSAFKSQNTLSYYASFKLTATGAIKPIINGKIGTYVDCINLEGKFYMFIKRTERKVVSLYIQEYGTDIQAIGPATVVGTYTKPAKKSFSSFFITTSDDDQYFSVYWEVIERKSLKTFMGYNIFTAKKEQITSGETFLPFEDGLAEVTHLTLSNTGDFFLILKEYEWLYRKRNKRNGRNPKNYHVFHAVGNELKEYILSLSDKIPRNASITTDNRENLSITGLYSRPNEKGVIGIFSLRINFKQDKIVSENFEEFSPDFIKEGWSEKDWDQIQKKLDKGKNVENPNLRNLRFRDTQILADGSVLGTIENYHVDTTYSYDGRRNESLFAFHYEDIIAFKIDVSGKVEWLKRIPKKQISYNDYGYRSGYAGFLDGNKYYMIFNDNVNNYDESGMFITGNKFEAEYSKKNNAVGLVSLDIETGNITRKNLFDREDVESIAIPKLFKYNPFDNTMILYATVGNKERFGLLTITP